MNFRCLFGHSWDRNVRVRTNMHESEFYIAHCCRRCDKRVPATVEDAAKMAHVRGYIQNLTAMHRGGYRGPAEYKVTYTSRDSGGSS